MGLPLVASSPVRTRAMKTCRIGTLSSKTWRKGLRPNSLVNSSQRSHAAMVARARPAETPLETVSCATRSEWRKRAATAASRPDIQRSGRRRAKGVSRGRASRGENGVRGCPPRHWSRQRYSRTVGRSGDIAGEFQKDGADKLERNQWWCCSFVPKRWCSSCHPD